MSDIDGSAGSENGEHAGIIEASGVCEAVPDLEVETDSVSTRIRQVTGRVIYLGTSERGARANDIGDAEAVLGEGVQGTTWIVKEFEGLVTGVGDGRGNLQVLQTIDLGVWDRCPDGQTGDSGNGDGRGNDGEEGNMEGRGEHGSEKWTAFREALEVNEPGLSSDSDGPGLVYAGQRTSRRCPRKLTLSR